MTRKVREYGRSDRLLIHTLSFLNTYILINTLLCYDKTFHIMSNRLLVLGQLFRDAIGKINFLTAIFTFWNQLVTVSQMTPYYIQAL